MTDVWRHSGNPEPTVGTGDVTTLSNKRMTFNKSINSLVDSRHDEPRKLLDEVVKSNQVRKTVSDIIAPLATVEARVNLLDQNQEDQVHQVVADSIRVEIAELRSRLDNFEDRTRTDNLIFYGFEDTTDESGITSKKKFES